MRTLLSQSLSWLPLFAWVLTFNSQLGGPIFSVWFCLWGVNINKVTALHRVISYLALFLLLFGIYIKKFCVFCQQLPKKFLNLGRSSEIMSDFTLTFEKKTTFTKKWGHLRSLYAPIQRMNVVRTAIVFTLPAVRLVQTYVYGYIHYTQVCFCIK